MKLNYMKKKIENSKEIRKLNIKSFKLLKKIRILK